VETAETRHYPNPPIIEAVIQMVFETTLKESEVVKCSESYARSYPGAQEFRLVEFAEVKPGATVNLKHGDGVQFRRATDDQQEVLIVTNEFIAIAALAPYKGWSNLIERFERDWGIWRRELGHRTIARLGLRYVNRIDVRREQVPSLVPDGMYVRTWIEVPAIFGPTHGYAMQARFNAREINCEIILNSGIGMSPVPEHMGVTIDIDLIRQTEVPQKYDELRSLLESMRVEKNRLFEALVTDNARSLFR